MADHSLPGTPASFPSAIVLLERFLNTTAVRKVFIHEGGRVTAGEAILSDAPTVVPVESEFDALEGMVQQHSRLVYRIAYAVLRSPQDAEDAAQETFMRVLRYRHKLADVEDHKTWLARIAWRVAVDRSKTRGRTREISLNDEEKPLPEYACSDAAADDVLHGVQMGNALARMIAALPEKLRQPLILSTIEEMSPREVAATLGISEAAVRSRVFRARQILREKCLQRVERK